MILLMRPYTCAIKCSWYFYDWLKYLAYCTTESSLGCYFRLIPSGPFFLSPFFSCHWVLGESEGNLHRYIPFVMFLNHHLVSITAVNTVTPLFVIDESLECWKYFRKPLVSSFQAGNPTSYLADCSFPFKYLFAAFHFLLSLPSLLPVHSATVKLCLMFYLKLDGWIQVFLSNYSSRQNFL